MKISLQRFFSWSRCAGIEAQFSGGEIIYHFILLKRNRNKVSVEKKITAVTDTKKICAELKKDIPVSLVITGRSVLGRKVECDVSISTSSLLGKVLPGSPLKDLYLQRFTINDESVFCAVARRDLVDPLLDRLKQQQISVVKCTLGVFPVGNLKEKSGKQADDFSFGKHRMRFSNDHLEEIQFVNEEAEMDDFAVGEENIESNLLPSFVAALELLKGTQVDAGLERLTEAKEELRQRFMLKRVAMTFLSIVLLVLTFNYFAFSHYWSEKSRLEAELQSDGGAFTQLRSLESQLQERKKFIEATGLSGTSHQSWIADRIAAGLPQEIVLQELSLFPKVKVSNEDSIGFTNGLIEIAGNCSESIVLNKWIDQLKKETWIKELTVDSYTQDKSTDRGEFKIELSIN
jgi:Tfp pilus assembly protein PilN